MGVWDALIATTTQTSPEHFRGQAWAMRRAPISHPDLALRMSPEQAERALAVLRDGILSLPVEDAKMRSHRYRSACHSSSVPVSTNRGMHARQMCLSGRYACCCSSS